MKTTSWTIARLMQTFFGDYLTTQRKMSPHTVSTYRYAWLLFLRFLQEHKSRNPSTMMVSDLDADDLLEFLNSVEKERKNSVKTRNARLAAICAAVKYALAVDPTLPPAVHRILSVPQKKTARTVVGFLEPEEIDAILSVPDLSRWSGQRDRMLFETMYNTGARVSEISQAVVSDLRLSGSGGTISLRGKGRKERILPLWKDTVKHLRQWIRIAALDQNDPIFPSERGGPLSRSAIEKRLSRIILVAKEKSPSLAQKKVTPHILRHTTAMHMHDAGVELASLAMWLGHESIETTNIYLSTSMERKEKTLAKLKPRDTKGFRFKADDDLLAYLTAL